MSQPVDRSQATLGNFTIIRPAPGAAIAPQAGDTVAVEVDDAGGHGAFRAAVYDGDASPPRPDACYDSLVPGTGNTWAGKAALRAADGARQKNIVVYGQQGSEWSSAVINSFRIEQD